jgi:hypothetical protein
VKFAEMESVIVPPVATMPRRFETVAASPVPSIVPTKWDVKVAAYGVPLEQLVPGLPV